jgi:hypothetical protein
VAFPASCKEDAVIILILHLFHLCSLAEKIHAPSDWKYDAILNQYSLQYEYSLRSVSISNPYRSGFCGEYRAGTATTLDSDASCTGRPWFYYIRLLCMNYRSLSPLIGCSSS